MSERSLQASPQGIRQAKAALKSQQLTQEKLAESLEISRQPVSNFFTGKPVDNILFVQICERLKLNWQNICLNPYIPKEELDQLVQQVREKIQGDINYRCGTMRILDMEQPIELDRIYTKVNVLEKVLGRQRKEIDDIFKDSKWGSEEFDRFGMACVSQKRVDGEIIVKKFSKLMVLGKPGAGKTTFLKRLAIQCISAQFLPNHVPVFVTLKEFSEAKSKPSLLEWIQAWLKKLDVIRAETVLEILDHGRGLVLLDGLDEVSNQDSQRVISEIKQFSEQFRKNQFIVTCRIAAKEYIYEQFTEVEVADFEWEQIQDFSAKWFAARQSPNGSRFLEQLQKNTPVKELANNPLLLTLLCLEFEETGDFPRNRAELYERGTAVLLSKWDAKRGISRDKVYKNLSVRRKEDLLSSIALKTFCEGQLFFKQHRATDLVTEFIQNIAQQDQDPEVLRSDSEVILKSIEAQHGLVVERAKEIYSFSHLTFQEYFAARELSLKPETWPQLWVHIPDAHWREVFLLTTSTLRDASGFVIQFKQAVDSIVSQEDTIQRLLIWATQKTATMTTRYKLNAVRSYYSLFLKRMILG